jgi:molecular chaperone GrpE
VICIPDKKEEETGRENNQKKEPSDEAQEGKVTEKKDESEELKERLLRLAAEFDNYKKRVAKDIENSKNMGKAELALRLLPILDEFQIALDNMDLKTEHGKGIAIVLSNLMDTMKREGLKEIESSGIYDPYKHEIMMTREDNQKEGTIIDVVRPGYTWNGLLLRPASVIVSRGIDAKEEKDNKKS